MQTNTRENKKLSQAIKFVPRPDRTFEWLGGISYNNLDKALANIKALLIESKTDEIHMMVSSFGGSTGIGMSFYDAVKTLWKPNLTTIGSGDVDSSGLIVFLAGQKRFLTKNTTLLLHLAGRTFEDGKRFTTKDMETMLKEDNLKDYQYSCVVSDATSGRYSPEGVLDLMEKNTILTAEEAVQMGLAHKVLE